MYYGESEFATPGDGGCSWNEYGYWDNGDCASGYECARWEENDVVYRVEGNYWYKYTCRRRGILSKGEWSWRTYQSLLII